MRLALQKSMRQRRKQNDSQYQNRPKRLLYRITKSHHPPYHPKDKLPPYNPKDKHPPHHTKHNLFLQPNRHSTVS